MKNSSTLKRLLLALIAAGGLPVTMTVSAQTTAYPDYKENGWFAGINVGKSSANIDTASIKALLENNGFGVNSVVKDTSNEGYKIYLGYQFGSYIALEGGYFDLGDFSFLASTLPESNFAGQAGLKGWNLDLVGMLPISDRFSAFARLGVTRNDTETGFSSNGLISTAAYDRDESYTKHKFGLGLQYDISAAVTVRLEAERYRMDDLIGNDGDIDLYSVGLVYRFGHTHAPYVATVAPEPAVVPAPAPAAAPVPRAQPVVAPPAVLLLQDVHFNFDTSDLNADTKLILRKHVQTLKANPDAKVRIAGYTSASGTKAYNQALSERRADAIKAFLVQEGLVASRFTTIGFGQSSPAQYEAKPVQLQSAAAKANMRGLFEIIIE